MSQELILAAKSTTTNYVIVRDSNDLVWNGITFETWSNARLSYYTINLPNVGGDLFVGDFPTCSTGTYSATYYTQAGASPTTTDAIVKEEIVEWDGTEEVTTAPALSADALTDLSSTKLALKISGTSKDNLLTLLINQSSAEIQRYCNRIFQAQNYVETAWVNYQQMVILRNTPLIKITRIGFSRQDVLSIENSTALRATALITDSALELNTIDSVGTATVANFPFNVYKTTLALVAAINGVSGYTAVLYDNVPSDELWPSNGINVSGVQMFGAIDPNEELLDYDINTKIGAISFNVLPTRMVRVWYRGGFETIPDDIAGATREYVRLLYNEVGRNPMLQSEALGDYSYSSGGAWSEIQERFGKIFAKYRFIPVADTIPQNIIQSSVITSDTTY